MSSIALLSQNIRTLCTDARLKEALNILLTTHYTPIDSSTYIHLLQACIAKKSLSDGKQIHSHISHRGLTFATHTVLQNTLINMYDNCGSLVGARNVFDHMTEQNVYSWNMIIAAYRRHGIPQEAFTLFHQMQKTDVQPDQFTFSGILPVCANTASVKYGLQIHGKIIRCEFQSDVTVMNSLVDMYAKCRNIQKARDLFEKMKNANVVSWNAMITGYAQNGFLDEALKLFKETPQLNVVSWNAMIVGCAQNGLTDKALEVFKQMQLAGIKPNSATCASILPACAKMGDLEQGKAIHQTILENDLLSDVRVVTALTDMYAKCGSIQKACKVFDKMPQRDVTSWNAMIVGYAQNGLVDKALENFKQMQLAGVKPDSSAFAGILPACAKLGALSQDMYAKCESLQKARDLFDKMSERDIASLNAMIVGYVQNGLANEALEILKEMHFSGYLQNELIDKALELFNQMQLEHVKPDSSTLASILPACAKLGALEQGMEIHQKIIESGFYSDVVFTALIDMYAKCGSVLKARGLFDKMHHPGVVSWNAMLAGYAMHGHSKDALKLFELMNHSGTIPDHISFICILFACSHAGLVDDGCKYFIHMSDSYYLPPKMDHYVCMVDLLGRAGHLDGALNFIIKIPIKPDAVVWMSMLGTCRSHKNIVLGEFVAELLFELNPKNAAAYVLLSNMYADVGRWSDVQKLRKLMKDRGIKKTPGCSWIEVHKMVHAFCVGDKSHPQTQEIYA
ncbi:hypothetical protein KI387_041321 [Taxus chinensis]|uniref:Pentatricopeptide repeat-containing protein n=1 Tax=Taxus chinensis TaxID=29808 RepID=A0AA38CC06_TAXCH|nr:hypothetical protein KI387_041321 [Taxus chinensis]